MVDILNIGYIDDNKKLTHQHLGREDIKEKCLEEQLDHNPRHNPPPTLSQEVILVVRVI